MAKIINTYALMAGIEKYVVSGAIPNLTSVAWHDEDGAWTDGSTIHLPRPNALWNDEQLMIWRYKAEHELGHEDSVNACPHWKEIMEDKRKDKRYAEDGLLWWISNLISDHVQEHNRVFQGYIGRDDVLLMGREAWLNDSEKQVGDKKVAKNPDMEIASGLFKWDTEQRMKWNSYITPKSYSKEATKIGDMVKNKSGVDSTVINNELQVFNAALKVRELFPSVPPKNDFMKIMSRQKGGRGKGSGEYDPDGDTGDKTDHSDPFFPNGNHGEAKRPISYDYKKGDGSYTPREPVMLSKGARRYGGGSSRDSSHISAVTSLLKRTNLPAKVRSYLMHMKREKLTTGWRSGRLDTSRLTDVLRHKDDLFRRKEPVHLVDSAVYLLVDSSGSMSGSSYQSACASAIMLAEALQGIKVSVEVAGFTEFGPENKGGLIHDIWLPFGQRFVRENVLNKMAIMSNNLSNNVDGENILYAYNRLKAQKETRKILIVLSDGEPSGSGPEGATMGTGQFTKNVCQMIEKDKSVLLVGLGMKGYKPDRFYKNAYQVDRGQSLEPVLLDIVKNAVIRK